MLTSKHIIMIREMTVILNGAKQHDVLDRSSGSKQ